MNRFIYNKQTHRWKHGCTQILNFAENKIVYRRLFLEPNGLSYYVMDNIEIITTVPYNCLIKNYTIIVLENHIHG